jgi:hypothetical protein
MARVVRPVLLLVATAAATVAAQTLQKGIERDLPGSERLAFDYVGFRAAVYDSVNVHEPENEHPNRGGWISLYYTNRSDKPVRLAFWRVNDKDESHWRLSPAVAWDRAYHKDLAPGRTSVLEINAVSEELGPGNRIRFQWVDRDSWAPVGFVDAPLVEDPVQVALFAVRDGRREVLLHVRNQGRAPVRGVDAEVLDAKAACVEWLGRDMPPGGCSIARVRLEQPLPNMQLAVVRLTVESEGVQRRICSHRRAYDDVFPIGTWGAGPDSYSILRRHHISTCVRGGEPDDDFFGRDAKKFDFHAIVPAQFPSSDSLRALADHPHVRCLMLSDEPDWSTPPTNVLQDDRIARHFNPHKPTFVTLCRNVTFFKYAQIPDIPCMDHYSVTAPSSSLWPTSYGTRLEETGVYTRDLKAASEPKPIWVWSQGLHEWSERPLRPLPTPDELAFQLWQNIGNGAKGILWFTFQKHMGERYPDTREAVRRCGRLLRIMQDDLLVSEPVPGVQVDSPRVDARLLVGPRRAYLVLTNLDYEIDPEEYHWTPARDLSIRVPNPSWTSYEAAYRLQPDGVVRTPIAAGDGFVEIQLDELPVWAVFALGSENEPYQAALEAVLADEAE